VTFSWTHNDDIVTRRITLLSNSSILTIRPFRTRNAGNYVCTVKSGSLSVMSDPANLTIYGMYYTVSHKCKGAHTYKRHVLL